MKGAILTTLTFVLCVAVPQCFASEDELLELLRGLTSDEKAEGPFKPLPPTLESGFAKRKSDPKACGKYADARRDPGGTVDFPEGDSDYSSSSDCAWAIIGGPRYRVTVTFTFVEIENDKPCDDYMIIYSMQERSPGNYDYTPLSEKICPKKLSDMTTRTFTTDLSGIYVEFKSDWWSNEKGFIFNYQIQQTGGILPPNLTPSPGNPEIGKPIAGGAGGGAIVPGGSSDTSGLNCDFDRGSLCSWKNINSDTLDWKIQSGSSSPWKTWGKTDHTTGTGSGSYAYLYTNDASVNSAGKMVSAVLSAESDRCLTFYYNMMQTEGVLKVVMNYNGGGSQTVLHREGSQGNGWLKATVTLMSKQPYTIEIEHTRGSGNVETGLAIDDVVMTNQACPTRLTACGTNIYGSRKKRDLRSLLKSLIELEDKKEEKELEDEKKELENRIIGGQMSQKGQFPWIVHIRIFTKGIQSGSYSQCGGSIINENWILSAAHCIEGEGRTYNNPNNVRIYLGEHNTHYGQVEESQFVLVPEKIVVHPDRNPNARGIRAHQYDVILIKLKYKLTYTDTVNAVCLPDRPIPPGTNCIAAGWGVAESGDSSDSLLHLSKLIQSDSECTPYTITEDMICAIAQTGYADVCQGDSGGPLVCKRSNRYELAGAVSFGDACSSKRRTSGVYADIYYFMPWIQSTVNSG